MSAAGQLTCSMMAGLSIVNNVPLQSNRAPSASFSCSPVSTTSSPCCFSAGAALPFRESSRNQVLRIGDVIRGNRVGGAKVVCTRKRGAVIPMAMAKREPLKVMISGAPASGKGTQSELILKKYGLAHIAAGDLLRAEVASGTENGIRAKEYMEKGSLVPNDIVVMMVKERLSQQDAQENGWLLDGYPRSLSQAAALDNLGIRPDLFILLDVPDEILVERVVGRRLDPVTGKIYHLKYSPPETEEIAQRLTQRFDDTEEKVKLRLKTHHKNLEDVLSNYTNLIWKVDGNRPKEQVFAEIDAAIAELERKQTEVKEKAATGGN